VDRAITATFIAPASAPQSLAVPRTGVPAHATNARAEEPGDTPLDSMSGANEKVRK
jgi:hypothetical protein